MPRDEKEEGWNTVEPTLCLKLVCEAIGTFGLSYSNILEFTPVTLPFALSRRHDRGFHC